MTGLPETRYVRSADGTKIAYQVTGDGPIDLLVLAGVGTPLDLMWDEPSLARISKRLGSFSRTIWLEPRGMGASEGVRLGTAVDDAPEVDADLIALLDGLGCDRAVLFGAGFSGPGIIRFAALRPERVEAVVLVNSAAYYVQEADYPWGFKPSVLDRIVADMKENWGTAAALGVMAPSRVADDRFRAWYARGERLGGGPDQTAQAFRITCERDVRSLLASIRAPTLVVHRDGNRLFRIGAGQYIAEHIPGAKFVALPGDDHLFFVGDADAIIDEVEEFLTGRHQAPEGDVVLATVLFTDIINSTQESARLGPRQWSKLIDEHDALVRGALQRHRGREIKTMGDGFIATFDGASRAVRCATEIASGVSALGIEVRTGLHVGEIEARGHDIAGMAVTVAKRICDFAAPSEVLVSETVRLPMVGSSGIEFEHRGEQQLKGVPGSWKLFAVRG
jgi:class 3 adenylate cyclase